MAKNLAQYLADERQARLEQFNANVRQPDAIAIVKFNECNLRYGYWNTPSGMLRALANNDGQWLPDSLMELSQPEVIAIAEAGQKKQAFAVKG